MCQIWLRRHGLVVDGSEADGGTADGLALAEPALAAIAGASVVGRVATGPRAGHLVLRLGADARVPVVSSGGPRHAHREGFDLHADTAVRAGDRRRLERLCRYVLRPPLAQDALERDGGGAGAAAPAPAVARRHAGDPLRAERVAREAGGAGACPELDEGPRPRANLLVYHGALAARGCCRVARTTATRAERSSALAAAPPAAAAPAAPFPRPSNPSSAAAAAPSVPRAPPQSGHASTSRPKVRRHNSAQATWRAG